MKVNIRLSSSSTQIAETLRNTWYPGSDRKEIRDAYVIDEAIRRFDGDVSVLAPYIAQDDPSATTQRLLTWKQETHEKARLMAALANQPMATVVRALLAKTAEDIKNKEKENAEKESDSDSKKDENPINLMGEIEQLEADVQKIMDRLRLIKSYAKIYQKEVR